MANATVSFSPINSEKNRAFVYIGCFVNGAFPFLSPFGLSLSVKAIKLIDLSHGCKMAAL